MNAQPWCSTRVDALRNHVYGSFDICPSTCKVNNCPVGYTRTFPDKSCHRIAAVSKLQTAKSFDDAEEICRREGARLYHPRNMQAWDLLLNLTGPQMDDPFPYQGGGTKFIALGMRVDFTQGYPILQYSDGTPVPETLVGKAFAWKDSTYPLNEPTKACVALDGRVAVNRECDGYYDSELVTFKAV